MSHAILVQVCPKHCMGHSYIKKLVIIYTKLNFKKTLCALSGLVFYLLGQKDSSMSLYATTSCSNVKKWQLHKLAECKMYGVSL